MVVAAFRQLNLFRKRRKAKRLDRKEKCVAKEKTPGPMGIVCVRIPGRKKD